MSMEKTTAAARGRWREILLRFGMDEKFLKDEHGACPACGGTDRYRWDNKDGNGTFYCSQCGSGTGMRLLMELKGWDFSKAAREVDQILGTVHADAVKAERTEKDKRASIKRVLGTATPVSPGTPAWIYLERRCGDPTGMRNLRAHAALRYSPDTKDCYPALLAIMRSPSLDDTKNGVNVHRTYLTPDGMKADLDPVRKIMQGLPLEGAAVRLGPIQERLGIAEGIETAICAGKLFGMPVWSALSANGILSWIPPEGVRSVVIFGDNDLNYVGQAAAYERARQLRVKGYDVEVQIPGDPGDWNDVWGLRAPLQEAS